MNQDPTASASAQFLRHVLLLRKFAYFVPPHVLSVPDCLQNAQTAKPVTR